MSNISEGQQTWWADWSASLRGFTHPRVVTMLFLGFSAGIPILLIFSSLSLWLREAGVGRSAVTMFSWAALGYSFKFIWAPLVDKLPLPLLTKWLGRRRGWMLLSQFAVIASIFAMGSVDPAAGEASLKYIALAAVALGFSSATQDIVIDAYRIESADEKLQALMSGTYITGYRIGMIVAGAGALVLAQYFGSTRDAYVYDAWFWTYAIMSLTMLIGVLTTLNIAEPERYQQESFAYANSHYLRLLLVFAFCVFVFIAFYWLSADVAQSLKSRLKEALENKALSSFIVECLRLTLGLVVAALAAAGLIKAHAVDKHMVGDTFITPVNDFFARYGLKVALLLLLLIGTYRISDIVLGVISNVFYQDLGFDKNTIAGAVKTFGLLMTIVGGLLGGILALRFGVIPILFVGAVLSALTNILFIWLANMGDSLFVLYLVIAADNLSAGLASAAFVAFLSSLTNISFTATQYAIFSSLMTLLPKMIGGYSGSIVDASGYSTFFFITALMGLPVLLLIAWISLHAELKTPELPQKA
ncbi:MAG: AmpG family muropeptide MFS transporter [Arenicellales bacterium WSBS_2016_MAG_OTU3]